MLQTFVQNLLNVILVASGGIGLIVRLATGTPATTPAIQVQDQNKQAVIDARFNGNLRMSGGLTTRGPLTARSGVYFGLYPNCTALETSATGGLICGTDDTGGGGGVNTGSVLRLLQATDNATSTGHLVKTFKGIFLASSTGSLKNLYDANYFRTSTGSLKALFDSLYFRSSTGSLKTYFDGLYFRSSTGALRSAFDNRYVNTAGDTMTGALKVRANLSGSTLNVDDLFACSNLKSNAGGRVSCNGALYLQTSTGSLQAVFDARYLGFPTVAVSGQSNVVADAYNDTLTLAAGSNVSITTTAGTDTVTIAATDTNTTYAAGQGLSLNGTLFALNATNSGSLARYATLSGSVVFAKTALASSGTLVVNSGVTFKGLSTCTALQTASNGALSCNNAVYLASSTGSLVQAFKGIFLPSSTGSLKVLFDANYLRTSTGSLEARFNGLFFRSSTGSLKAYFDGLYFRSSTGALRANFDGRYVNTSGDTLTGALLVKANISGASLRVSNLKNCDTIDTDLNGNLSCGSDATGTSVGAWSGTGALATFFDRGYVNTSGDTMTGKLLINLSSGTDALEVIGVASGRVIHAQDQLRSSGSLVVDGSGSFTAQRGGESPLRIFGAASQTANLTEWRNSAGTILASVDAVGGGHFTGNPTSGGGEASTSVYYGNLKAINGWGFAVYNGLSGGAGLIFNTDVLPVLSQTVSDGTTNLGRSTQRWGTVYAVQGQLLNNTAGNIALTVKGASSQSANLQEWQKSDGTVYSFINNSGALTLRPGASVREALNARGTVSGSVLFAQSQLRASGSLAVRGSGSFTAVRTGETPIRILALSSQVGNLTEWRDGSLSLLTSVTKDGYLRLPAGAVTTQSFKVGANNAGLYETAGTALGFTTSGLATAGMVLGSANLTVNSTLGLGFSSGDPAAAGADVAFSRLSAGLIKLNNGSTGYGNLYVGTASGRIVRAQDTLASSGTLVVKGSATVDAGTLFVDSVNHRVGVGTTAPAVKFVVYGGATDTDIKVQTANTGLLSTDGFNFGVENSTQDVYFSQRENAFLRVLVNGSERITINPGGQIGIGNSTPKGKFVVAGSGTFMGAMSGSSLTVSNLRNCDTIDTNAAGVLTCGTDATGGAGSFDQASTDKRYVQKQGDTMTGALTINLSSGTVGLKVVQTASGHVVTGWGGDERLVDEYTYVVCPQVGKCDFTNLQSALTTAANTSNGRIFVRAGVYPLSTALTVTGSNLDVQGEGMATQFTFNGVTVPTAFKMGDTTQRTNSVFRNLRFTNTGATGSGVAIDASYFAVSRFENIYVDGNPKGGLLLNSNTTLYNSFSNFRIAVSGSGSYGVLVDGVSNENTFDRFRIQTGRFSSGAYINAHANTLRDVDVETGGAAGIHIGPNGNDTTIYSPYLEGNRKNLVIDPNVEAVTVVGGFIVDATTNNITGTGANGVVLDNVRLQYEPYSLRAINAALVDRPGI
jgi:hypothetical protein